MKFSEMLCPQVGSLEEASAAAAAGVDAIIAQGSEAGGHGECTRHQHRLKRSLATM